MKIRKAIIPAAGLGTRFLPATKSQPKEMLPVVDKPCIQYLVEEAVASGITEIIIITGRGKRSIEDHFDHSFELSAHLEKKGKKDIIAEMEKIEKLAKFIYIRQPFPQGDGHAILCAEELVKDEPFAVLFGDDIYDSETPALKQLIQQFDQYKSPIIALHQVQNSETNKYGIVDGEKIADRTFKISSLIEKPEIDKAPSNLAIAGKYIVTPDLLKELKNTTYTSENQELKLINGMQSFVKKHPIYGYEVEGSRFDTGDKLGYLMATVNFALKHKELNQGFKKYLKSLDLQ